MRKDQIRNFIARHQHQALRDAEGLGRSLQNIWDALEYDQPVNPAHIQQVRKDIGRERRRLNEINAWLNRQFGKQHV